MNILAQDEPAVEVNESAIICFPESRPFGDVSTVNVVSGGIIVFFVFAGCVLFMRGIHRQKPAAELHKERGGL